MKKLLALFISTVMVFALSGCEKYSDYREIETRLFVSAIGIDETASGITLYAESVASNTASGGYKSSVLSSTADTIPEALDGIKNASPLSLDLSHCAVIILGKRQENTEKTLCEYLLLRPEDMLSCYIVACDNAGELMSQSSDTPIGYSLSNALKKNDYSGGKRTQSTLLDILNNPKAFYLPYFKPDGNTYTYSGAAYYKGTERICLKNTNEARMITLLSGMFYRGQIMLGGQSVNIKNTDFTQKISGNTIDINLSLDLYGDIDSLSFENELLRILKEWKEDYKANVFGYCNGGEPLTDSEFSAKKTHLTLKLRQSNN